MNFVEEAKIYQGIRILNDYYSNRSNTIYTPGIIYYSDLVRLRIVVHLGVAYCIFEKFEYLSHLWLKLYTEDWPTSHIIDYSIHMSIKNGSVWRIKVDRYRVNIYYTAGMNIDQRKNIGAALEFKLLQANVKKYIKISKKEKDQ